MKKTFGKVLVALLVSVAFISLVGCNNNADSGGGGGDSAPPIALSSSEDVTVLGSYNKSGIGTLSFNEDKTGSYTTGSSANIRAATAIPKFTWTASKTGSNIEITIKYNGKTGTLTRSSSDGKISGKLDDNDNSTQISDFGYKAPSEGDLIGTWKLSWPSQGKMDENLKGTAWYVLSVTFASSGGNNSANADVRHLNDYGTSSITKPYTGTWFIGTTGADLGYIILRGLRTSDSLLKLNGNKKTAIVYDSYWGVMVFNKQ